MAVISYTIPNAGLALLDAYAQEKRFTDFDAMTRDFIKNSYRNARREKNRRDAADLIAIEPPDVAIT